MEKITQNEKYEMIIIALEGIVNTANENVDVAEMKMLIKFCNDKITQNIAKQEKAKARAAKKKSELDTLAVFIYDNVLTEVPMTVDAITEAVTATKEFAYATKNKVVARLTKLVNGGQVERTEIKVEGHKGKVKAYAIYAPTEDEAE